VVVGSSFELTGALSHGQIAVIPAIEGASPIEDDMGRLAELYDRGLRVLGLTWNSRNRVAVGLNAGEGGLSPLGERVLEFANDHGVVVDLAHASAETFWDVARRTAAPLVVSHANASSVWSHPRNLTDAQLDAVAQSNGVVGLCFYPSFVSQQPVSLAAVVDHARYVLARLGGDHLCIGADFIDYALDEILADLSDHGDLYPRDELTYPE
jgi:membrane dipeptidase